jgi:type I restriction enzyme R subunit
LLFTDHYLTFFFFSNPYSTNVLSRSLSQPAEWGLEGLAEKGYGDEQLTEISRLVETEKSDLYDVLAYLAYAIKPISREDRTIIHKTLIFSRYTGKQQEFLDFVLAQYIKEGVRELDSDKLKPLLELKYHAVHDAIAELGNVASIRETFIGFQQYLYSQDQAA